MMKNLLCIKLYIFYWFIRKKQQINQRYKKNYIDKKNFTEAIVINQSLTRNKDKNNYDLLVTKNLLSSKYSRELRILSIQKIKMI
jgi:hypothetical protein